MDERSDLKPTPLGAVPRGSGKFEFRVVAPDAQRLRVRVGGAPVSLAAVDGLREAIAAAEAGAEYAFVFDDGRELPDPCSRAQPRGVRGPSAVVDPACFVWSDADWAGLALDELVLYELHVGTFTDAGTFDGVVPHLPALRDLGVTAIELMPVATFPGDRGWGYDGLYAFAPHPAYGGPMGLRRLVDAAHTVGLGVVLDVVYNHIGPGSEALSAFAPVLQ